METISRQVHEWLVPSQREPGKYYSVKLYPNGGTQCPCSWGQKADAPSKCWHAQFARCMENDEVRWLLGDLRYNYQAACRGDVLVQVAFLAAIGEELARRGRMRAASACYEVMQKYLGAISVQGAGDPTKETEAARVAAPTGWLRISQPAPGEAIR